MANVLDILSAAQVVQVGDTLGADVQRCIDELKRSADQEQRLDQFWARAVVRSFFAYVEAFTFELKMIVLKAHEHNLVTLSEGEVLILTEKTYELDHAGRPRMRERYAKSESFMLFVHSLFARLLESEGIRTDEHGWELFQQTVQLRHRITHPKGVASLELSVKEAEMSLRAVSWFFGESARLADMYTQRINDRNYIQKLDERFGCQAQHRLPLGDA